ncbi:unnamed protein product [Rotaria socialis]|uniref:Uncharacterized protein n=2 Tax=Rotaria socialis TaxID=392032 RepID=A0A821DP32_9BILA|nr:unnamed protein product [Rotaria socialis]CAF4624383.1 unnamed protein product [Rotaria socialis]
MSESRKTPKRKTTNDPAATPVRLDLPSNSMTSINDSQRAQQNAPEFTTYRARRSNDKRNPMAKYQPSQNVLRKKSINTMNVLDNDEDNELRFGANQYVQYEADEDDEDDLQEEPVIQKQKRATSHNDTRRNNTGANNTFDKAHDSNSSDEEAENPDTNHDNAVYQIYFNEKFDQLRADVHNCTVNTTNSLAGGVQTQMAKVDKQLRSLSRSLQDNSHHPALAIYQNLSNEYPRVVEFNGTNLLDVAKSADYKKYARTILKLIFSPGELSNSVLISNRIYARPGLDPQRMAIWAEAVGARFKIDRVRFEDFFRTCFHRSLAQMLCDIHRVQKRAMGNPTASDPSGLTSAHDASFFDGPDSPGVAQKNDNCI